MLIFSQQDIQAPLQYLLHCNARNIIFATRQVCCKNAVQTTEALQCNVPCNLCAIFHVAENYTSKYVQCYESNSINAVFAEGVQER